MRSILCHNPVPHQSIKEKYVDLARQFHLTIICNTYMSANNTLIKIIVLRMIENGGGCLAEKVSKGDLLIDHFLQYHSNIITELHT